MSDSPLRTNEALHEQRDWLQVTLSSIGDAVVTTDTDGRVTFMNPVAESLTGWTLADATSQPLVDVFNIINQDTRNTVESPTVRALRDGVIVGLANHTLLISKDGTERPIDDSAAPIRNQRNEVAGVVLVFRDITERYRQEQTIRDTLNYANNVIATLREPFLVINGELKVHTANRSYYENFHVTPEETEGRHIYDLGSGQWDIPRLRSLLAEVVANHHAVLNYEVEHDFPAIGRRSMLLNAVRIHKPGNHSDLILLAIEDVTDRKRAEAALVVSEVRYRRLFESARDGILILDFHTGRITDANPFMYELLGYSTAEFIGKELWEIGLFADKSGSEAAVRELQQNGYIRYEHLPLETRRGKQVEVEVVANAYQEDHKPVIQCNIRDITERSRMERKVKEQAEALADLHRRKDEFLAMLSHELRNPLAPISNAVLLLRLQDGEDPLQRQARTVIERQVAQLRHLIDDLLEVSRITMGRIHLRQERIAVSGVVERAVEATRPLLDQHRHELTVGVPPEPIWLLADAARLEQVVVNLLTNAAKYTSDGGRIGLTVQQEGDEAVLRLRDTGVGIAPELLPRIFDLFTQAERSLDRSQGGLGIGLALVQRLVELHHGRVEVHSTLGRGSEFVVRLPVMLSPAPSPPTPPPKAATKAAGKCCRVLVVDDNVDAADSLAQLLKAYQHDARTAYDGPAAVEAAVAYRPDLILLDIGLPRMDGYEVARRVRQEPTLAGVVLVALTGYGLEADREKAKAAGFDHHLTKPADFAKVQDILAAVAAG
jgi:PAS domain S-box-containing protein